MNLFVTAELPERIEGLMLLHGYALSTQPQLLDDLNAVIEAAPFRQMMTPMGGQMSVATTNCGRLGWISDAHGYRYVAIDPQSGQQWPSMPQSFFTLASAAAKQAGYANFEPDACLINRYQIGTKMGLHQDKDERDFNQPIVSVSLGIPARFQFGGKKRSDKLVKLCLEHGDVVVWGGVARLYYHGIMPIQTATHPIFGQTRINLTFRKAT